MMYPQIARELARARQRELQRDARRAAWARRAPESGVVPRERHHRSVYSALRGGWAAAKRPS